MKNNNLNNFNYRQKVITIDGPTASGKGTIAHLVAQKLNWHVLDSGALYRLSALYYQQKRGDLKHHWEYASEQEIDDLCILAKNLPCFFTEDEIYLSDEPVSHLIRAIEISEQASQIAALPKLRNALLERQHSFLKESIEDHQKGLVADGRDMGTIVFTDAILKIYLTASSEVRARRRTLQYLKITDTQAHSQNIIIENGKIYHDILTQLNIRDSRDMNRKIAPLFPAASAIIIDSTDQSIDAIVESIVKEYQDSLI